jgi:biotin operon repressor
MRKIDIFVSGPADVRRERALAERIMRSVASEFGVPLAFSYSNPLRGSKEDKGINAVGIDSFEEGTSWLCPSIWEYPELESGEYFQIPNTGQFDLVVCILGSRLGAAPAPVLVMPDGSRPRTVTDYEVAWALDQSNRVPGHVRTRVFRNRSNLSGPKKPNERCVGFSPQKDSVEDFFANWQQVAGSNFRDACRDYRSPEEFERIFREDFRDFLTDQLDREIVKRQRPRQAERWGTNPFRGLNFFDIEHAPVFHGRTATIVEIIERLEKRFRAGSPFVLLSGDRGSGKSSLARAGILPFLSEAGEFKGNAVWRRAVTRPGPATTTDDPFDTLSAALIDQFALPELQWVGDARGLLNLSLELSERPEAAASWIKETLDRLSSKEFDRIQEEQKSQALGGTALHAIELAKNRTRCRVKPIVRIALVVDPLEELFTSQYSSEVQKKYVAALKALIQIGGVFVIATLRSEYYDSFAKFDDLVEMTGSTGRFDVQPPGRHQLAEIIRLPAREAGLRFDRDIPAGGNLDDLILDAATKSAESLPLLEHLLSQLYRKQARRKDGLLRFADYQELGGFEGALANHAETLFDGLKSDEQSSFGLVMQRLVSPGRKGEVKVRTARYSALVSTADLDRKQLAGAKGLLDRLISAGLLKVQSTSRRDLWVSISSESVLQRWPRFREWFLENRDLLRMKERLDGRLKIWVSRGRANNDLLRLENGLPEAEKLLENFRSALNRTELDYIKKSLDRSHTTPFIWKKVRFAVGAFLALFALGAVTQWFFSGARQDRTRVEQIETSRGPPSNELAGSKGKELESKQEIATPTLEIIDAAVAQLRSLEAKIKDDLENPRQTPSIVDSAVAQLRALGRKIAMDEERARRTRSIVDVAVAQLVAIGTKIKGDSEKLALTRTTVDRAIAQLGAIAAKIKVDREKLALTRTTVDGAFAQLGAVGAKIKGDREKLAITRTTIDGAVAQLSAIGTKIKGDREKTALTRTTVDGAVAQLIASGTKIKGDREKTALTRTTVDGAVAQLNAIGAKIKSDWEKTALTRTTVDGAVAQLNAFGAKIKSDRQKLALTRTTVDGAVAQLNAFGAKIKSDRQKTALTRTTIDGAVAQLNAIGTKIKSDREKTALTRATVDGAIAQLGAVGAKIKGDREKLTLTRTTIDGVVSQLSAIGTKIKGDRQKLALTRTTIDGAVAQLNAIGTKIKSDRQKLALTRTTIDGAVAQLNAIGTKIKSDREKTALTRATVDKAVAQLGAVGAKIKGDREKLALTRATVDGVVSQLNAIGTKIKSDRQKLALTRTTIDGAVAQLNAIGTKIKSDRQKLALTRTTVDGAVAQLNAFGAKIKSDRQKLALTRTTIDGAVAQLNAIGTKIKSDRQKLALTRTTVDGAVAQLNAIGTKIKSDREKVALTRTAIDGVIAQLGVIGAKTKNDRDKTGLSWTTIDRAVAQLGAIGTKIKSDREKLALTRATVDKAVAQLGAIGTKIKSDREKLALTRATVDKAVAQLGAIGTKIKSDREKTMLTRATVDKAVAQLGAIGTKIKSDREKAVLTRATVDKAVAQLGVIGAKIKSDREKAVLTRATVDKAVAQLGVIGAKIKSDREKAVLTRATVDKAVAQLGVIGTKIKSDREKAVLTRATVDKAVAQLGVIGTKIKSDREKTVLTRATVDKAVAQLGAIGTKIKSDREKTALTRATVEKAVAQLGAVGTKIKGDLEKAALTRTTIDGAIAQLGAFGMKIRGDQEKARLIRTTVDRAVAQLGSTGAKIKSDRENVRLIRTTMNGAIAQLHAIGAKIKSDEEKSRQFRETVKVAGTQPSARELPGQEGQWVAKRSPINGAPAPNQTDLAGAQALSTEHNLELGIGVSASERFVEPNLPEIRRDPSKTDPDTGNLFPDGESQLPVLPSTPPAPNPEGPGPSQPGDNQGANPATDEDSLKDFALAYLRTVARNDVSTQKQFFADRVSFYGRGVLSQEKVQSATQQYHDEWPHREWAPNGEAKVAKSKKADVYLIHQPFIWTVSDGSRTAQGSSTLYLRIRKTSQGEFQIVKIFQIDQ